MQFQPSPVLGDVFRPKSFAGLFGAAPSVGLATLAIAFWNQGPAYAALEGRSMMIGSLALCLYSVAVCQLMKRYESGVLFIGNRGCLREVTARHWSE